MELELSEAQGDRVVVVLRARLTDVHGGDVAALAAELGMLAPVVRRVLAGGILCPWPLADALARAEGRPLAAMLAGPREAAAEVAREAGIPERAIERVLAEPEPVGARPVLWYVDRMRAVARLGDGSGEVEAPRSRRAG